MKLEGKVALVTGGSRGIGEEICRELASLGASVIINYSSSADKALSLSEEINSTAGRSDASTCLQFDVGDEDSVSLAFKSIQEKFGRLDILVNNAGIAVDSLLLRMKLEDWDRVLRTNLTGIFLCSKAALKLLMRSENGRIINISSVVGEMGNAGQAAYSASKSAIFGFTKSLAKEVGSRAITVNAIAPGFIKTDMTASMKDEQVTELLKAISLNRLGEADEVAALVGFLACPKAGYITGQIIGINGGMYM
ncbi:MAG TPA: 3-oxoacyl-[acyl-carrier-protein] reductase [Oligoflexia bacterium]|nr:3-oxoacyl-[acyl-carrier-protein] reductase [Oligoflexia bacterium]HMP47254.1 3-oxoacyl-[acyl-carrier-protein] reductase [Oligoflexia bacterium]